MARVRYLISLYGQVWLLPLDIFGLRPIQWMQWVLERTLRIANTAQKNLLTYVMNLPFNHFQPTIQIISQQKKHITNINWTYRVIQGKVSLILTNIWMSFDESKKLFMAFSTRNDLKGNTRNDLKKPNYFNLSSCFGDFCFRLSNRKRVKYIKREE